jgi:hypothetical protein
MSSVVVGFDWRSAPRMRSVVRDDHQGAGPLHAELGLEEGA